jgi:hypothetical protein
MAGCVTGKKMYLTLEMAEDALIEAWIKNDYSTGKGPVTVYQCDDCKEFHLTSLGEMNTRLLQFIKEGKLKRQKEANFWSDKLKKK